MPGTQSYTAPSPPPVPRPLDQALERLSRLSQNGASAERMALETRLAMGTLAIKAESDHDLRATVNEMLETLEAGVEAAEVAVEDVDRSDEREVQRAAVVLAGVRASVQAVRERVG